MASPIAIPDFYSMRPGATLNVAAASGLLANDSDPDGHSFSIVSANVTGLNGSLIAQLDGSFAFTPTAGFTGTTSFTYTIRDSTGATAVATASINVINSSPVATADIYSVFSGGTLNVAATVGVLANDSDADGDTLSVVSVNITGLNGVLAPLGTGAFTFTPTSGFSGLTRFSYTVGDGFGGSGSSNATVFVINQSGIDNLVSDVSLNLSSTPEFLFAENVTFSGSSNLNGTGNALANTLTGNSGNNELLGEAGNDRLVGGAGADTLIGGAGDDTLDGGQGNDSMTGGSGNDVYVVDSTGDVVVEVDGVSTADTIETSLNYFVLPYAIENLTLFGSGYSQGFGTALANKIIGSAGDNNLFGNDGNDTIEGNAGGDYIYGGAGDNLMIGGVGVDRIYGDTFTAGADFVQGGGDQDLIYTYGGNDTLYGDAGNDWLLAGDGNDGVYGGEGYDNLDGGAGDDTLDGGNDVDILHGGDGNDTITDFTGNNWLFGDADHDILTGGSGYDNLDGGDGSDTLAGGGELDVLRGGLGNDLFKINAATDKGFVDWILDFGVGGFGDTIQLDVANIGAPQTTVGVYGTGAIITYTVGAGGAGNVGWVIVTNTSVATVNANLVFV